jgi:OOP family OmpA-OmpF porin
MAERRLRQLTGRVAPAVYVVALVVAAGWSTGDAEDAGQTRDLTFRVRDFDAQGKDLEYRWRTLDNSQRVEQDAEQTTVTFAADVLFDFDRADLTTEAQAYIDDLAQDLRDLGPRAVTIGGHTDSVGDPAYNEDLSTRRAEAVRTALEAEVGSGFSFDVAGYGETQPVAPNENQDDSDNPTGRALNRRVEISYPTD